MGRKTRKKCQASVQQTFCVSEELKKNLKGLGMFFLSCVASEAFTAIIHSDTVAFILASIKGFL